MGSHRILGWFKTLPEKLTWSILNRIAALDLRIMGLSAAFVAPLLAAAINAANDFFQRLGLCYEIQLSPLIFLTFMAGLAFYGGAAIVQIWCPALVKEFGDFRTYSAFAIRTTIDVQDVFRPDEKAPEEGTEQTLENLEEMLGYEILRQTGAAAVSKMHQDWQDLETKHVVARLVSALLFLTAVLVGAYMSIIVATSNVFEAAAV